MGAINKNFKLKGRSDKTYTFQLYTLDSDFTPIGGGIYVFVKLSNNQEKFNKIYCGKAEVFSARFQNHHKQDEIDKYMANAIGILTEDSDPARTEIEIDILEGNDFPCNDQHN